MRKIKVKVKGKAPLLMNRFSVEEKISSRTKKVYDPKEEAERKIYRTDSGKLYLPNTHFKASMIKSGTDFKMAGKKSYKEYVKAGIFIEPEEIILDPQKYEIHEEAVVIQRARVMSWRPKFKEWSCEFEIEVADEMLNADILKEILIAAGKYKGVGDHRPEYGRFEVVEWKLSK